MKSFLFMLTVSLVFLGCSSESNSEQTQTNETDITTKKEEPPEERFYEGDLLEKLSWADITIEPYEKSRLTPEDYKKLGSDPENYFTARVRFERESTGITFIEFSDSDKAKKVKKLNGFRVNNWYFAGTISTFWVDKIKAALQ